MECKTPEHWLTDIQIASLKHRAMGQMIENVLTKNPNACLFGGGVRDMILEAYKFGEKLDYWREYDKEKSVVSKDLDFLVTSEAYFGALKDFFASHYHVIPKESEYEEMDFAVYQASVNLIVGTPMSDKFSIFVDLVYRKEEQRIDFDVNTLMYNRAKGFFAVPLVCESKLEYLLRFTKIVQHIQTKTAHFSHSVADAKWLKTRQERGLAMMEKGWRLCHEKDVYTLGQASMFCTICSKSKEIIFRCQKKEKVLCEKEAGLSVVSFVCYDCWLEYDVANPPQPKAPRTMPDSGVVVASTSPEDSGVEKTRGYIITDYNC
jgi:hypothetical protein